MMRKNIRLNYYFGAVIFQLFAVAICIVCHRLFISRGAQIAAPEIINQELTNPTVGRLIYVFVAGAAFLLFAIFAVRSSKKEKYFQSFACATFSGIFLWQAIGEDVWHFSIGDTHFACLESIEVLPIAIALLLLIWYNAKTQSFDWGVICTVYSFLVNWVGHYALIGIYPIVASIIDQSVWNICVGIMLGAGLFISGLVCGIKKPCEKKSMIMYAILTYFGLGIFMFGLVG